MNAVAKLPSADIFASLAPKIDAMRVQRGNAIKAAMQRRDIANAAAERAKATREHALQEMRLADAELSRLMDKGEMVVIGDQLISLAPHGGVHVQAVKVLGIV